MPKLKNGYVFDEEKLINLVRKYECLYNMKSKDYKDDAMKDNIWADIAKELKVPDDQEPCPGKFYHDNFAKFQSQVKLLKNFTLS